jgi:hypothetical protein
MPIKVGMAMCAIGIGQIAAQGLWLHPLSILAYIIGALILVIVGANLFNLSLPLIESTRAAILAVILLAVLKVGITQLHRAFA